MLKSIAASWDKWKRRRFGQYWIDDPRPIAEGAPYTFYLSSENELLALAQGDEVKLIFQGDPPGSNYSAERMWVEIVAVEQDRLRGKLDNIPSELHQLRAGDMIDFERHQVIDIDWSKKRSEAPPSGPPRRWYWERCYVDRCVLDDGVPVYYLYREAPDDTGDDECPDSGWRFRGDWRGLTDEEFEARKSEYIAVGKVLNADDSWLHLVDEPVGSAFVREGEGGSFVACDD